ncbi:hypothetical protein SBA6_770022 [Candidatus Sulfopaludibacter sp. SbA6]|nr:hypothetical protein SBA6_770022 [Candidatus Sulfopaludibacter sp. SbA6]
MPGLLYVVATPIGNLEDITYRAVRVLGEADLIACEDTRQTRKLLDHYGIQKPAISYHDHNETERTAELTARLLAGTVIALVSDAGMPLVSGRHAAGVRSGLPAGKGRGRKRHPGAACAGSFGGARGPGRIGAAQRRVSLRGLPAARAGTADQGARSAGRRTRHPHFL